MDDFQHLDDHALLGVSPGASPDEIKQAYRREITKYHPDRYRHADSQAQQYARERSQRLTEAYSTLSRSGRPRLSPSSRAQFEGSAAPRSQGGFPQPTAGAQIAGWYEQATSLLAAGRADEALRLLRQIQRVDPFYRDVDELAAQAERMEATQPIATRATRRRQPFVWVGLGGLALLVTLAGIWGARTFQVGRNAQATPEPVVVDVASPAATAAVASGAELSAPTASLSSAPNALASASPSPAPREAALASSPTVESIPTPSAFAAEVIQTPPATPPTESATAMIIALPPFAASPPAPARPAVAIESGRVLVADNFNNPASGWSQLQAATYSLGYRNGAYAITTEPGTGAIFSFGAPLSQGNVVIGADVTPLRGSAGLLFGPDNSYRFFITGDGRYRVEQRGKALVPTTASKALRRGTNRLVLAAAGQRVSLYANGVLLTNLNLPSTLKGTTYGFVVAGGGNRGEGQFDTLTVRALPR